MSLEEVAGVFSRLLECINHFTQNTLLLFQESTDVAGLKYVRRVAVDIFISIVLGIRMQVVIPFNAESKVNSASLLFLLLVFLLLAFLLAFLLLLLPLLLHIGLDLNNISAWSGVVERDIVGGSGLVIDRLGTTLQCCVSGNNIKGLFEDPRAGTRTTGVSRVPNGMISKTVMVREKGHAKTNVFIEVGWVSSKSENCACGTKNLGGVLMISGNVVFLGPRRVAELQIAMEAVVKGTLHFVRGRER